MQITTQHSRLGQVGTKRCGQDYGAGSRERDRRRPGEQREKSDARHGEEKREIDDATKKRELAKKRRGKTIPRRLPCDAVVAAKTKPLLFTDSPPSSCRRKLRWESHPGARGPVQLPQQNPCRTSRCRRFQTRPRHARTSRRKVWLDSTSTACGTTTTMQRSCT